MKRRGVLGASARFVAILAACASGLYLVWVLGLGFLLVTGDWDAVECFDGDEPACREPARSGLSAIQASSWVLGLTGVIAAVGAFVLALRLRRVAHLALVLLLCTTSAVVAQMLWSRL